MGSAILWRRGVSKLRILLYKFSDSKLFPVFEGPWYSSTVGGNEASHPLSLDGRVIHTIVCSLAPYSQRFHERVKHGTVVCLSCTLGILPGEKIE